MVFDFWRFGFDSLLSRQEFITILKSFVDTVEETIQDKTKDAAFKVPLKCRPDLERLYRFAVGTEDG